MTWGSHILKVPQLQCLKARGKYKLINKRRSQSCHTRSFIKMEQGLSLEDLCPDLIGSIIVTNPNSQWAHMHWFLTITVSSKFQPHNNPTIYLVKGKFSTVPCHSKNSLCDILNKGTEKI